MSVAPVQEPTFDGIRAGLSSLRHETKGVQIMRARSLAMVSSLPLLAGAMYGFGHTRSSGVILDAPVSVSAQGAISSSDLSDQAGVSSNDVLDLEASMSGDFDDPVGLDCSACGGGSCPHGNCGNGSCCNEGSVCNGLRCNPIAATPGVLDASPAD